MIFTWGNCAFRSAAASRPLEPSFMRISMSTRSAGVSAMQGQAWAAESTKRTTS